jgi:hypothetical protein
MDHKHNREIKIIFFQNIFEHTSTFLLFQYYTNSNPHLKVSCKEQDCNLFVPFKSSSKLDKPKPKEVNEWKEEAQNVRPQGVKMLYLLPNACTPPLMCCLIITNGDSGLHDYNNVAKGR